VAEINSSFHRPHRLTTWQRWHDSVPGNFRFSVKLPKAITHEKKLADCLHELDEFVVQSGILRDKLGVLLAQLPPKLSSMSRLRQICIAPVTVTGSNPTHQSWSRGARGSRRVVHFRQHGRPQVQGTLWRWRATHSLVCA
jgi:uncharacterized protein YecE (DUF72 family)